MFAFKKIAALVLIFVFSTATTLAQPRIPERPRASDPGELAGKDSSLFADSAHGQHGSIGAERSPGAAGRSSRPRSCFDPLFLRQVWTGNEALKKKLEADKTSDRAACGFTIS